MFIYNGYDFSNDVKVLKITRPMLAPQDITSTDINGRAGSLFNRKTSKSYEIKIEIMFHADTPIECMDKLRMLGSKLDSSVPARLVFKDEPDKYIMAVLGGSTEPDRDGKKIRVEINFYCPDPYWYLINDETVNVTNPTTLKAFSRQGSAESYPIVEIKGVSGSTGVINLNVNGEIMTYTGSLLSGETLVIDSAKLTSYILKTNGTKVSTLPNFDKLDFPVLVGGSNTSIMSTSNGATLTSYKIYFNSRWK